MKNIIELKNVYKRYDGYQNWAIENISLSVKTGSIVAIVGESGSGKTTLLKLMDKLLKPTSGSVKLEGTVSVVFQSGALFPWLSAYDNVALPLKLRGEKKINKKVLQSLAEVGILDLRDSLPKKLSGGQRQRVGLARALAYNTDIILLDEPFSALDIKTASELHQDILNLWRNTGKTIIMISHQLEDVVHLAQEIIVLKNGKLLKKFENEQEYPRNEMSHESISLVHEIKKVLKVE
jgi:NitT/TauT family transport system ATP-binding protein